ncbi:MAG: hypothetical protein M1823_006327 [Watsoniomyces obsoletus]|nr:MAG: hypothetical protein M1823_006327 [Watsoniomyces obsoletus]
MSKVNSPAKQGPGSPISLDAPMMDTLPPPSTIDVVPALYSLLSRLLPSETSHDAPLEPQQLPLEATALKSKLQKARAAVEKLPDMDRTIEQQQREMDEMEEMIRQQRQMLELLASKARAASQSQRNEPPMEE